MNLRSLLIVLTTLVLLVACKKQDDKTIIVNDFPQTEQIKGRRVESIELFSRVNVNLQYVDSFLIVQKREDPLFSIFDSRFNLLSEFGRSGQGPDEFLFPEMTNQVSLAKNDSACISVYDYTRRKFTQIDLKSAISEYPGAAIHEFELPDLDQFLTYFFYYDKDLLLATPETGGRFVIYNRLEDTVKQVPYIPETGITIDPIHLSSIYRSACCVNKDLGLIASSPMLLGELDFFDMEGNHLYSSVFSPAKFIKDQLKAMGPDGDFNVRYYIESMHATNKYIYALNFNNYQDDVMANKSVSDQSIMIFDWEGNPIKRFILDPDYFIQSFAIDAINNRFIGYCADSSEHNIIVFDSIEEFVQ